MFDISFAEILIVAVVALIVIGPQRLPKVARTLGYLFGRAQRYANDVRSGIRHEMELEELKKLKTSMQEITHSFDNTVRQEINQLQEITETPVTTVSVPPLEIVAETKPVVEFHAAEVEPTFQSEPGLDDTPRELKQSTGNGAGK
ncbi:MAG: twin-arginine translocase subunit TatB [Nitrosomonadales bacterium]|nr:MAG: twin-arginine translocase subunit TatB [Nitrosomonadales bacterium]